MSMFSPGFSIVSSSAIARFICGMFSFSSFAVYIGGDSRAGSTSHRWRRSPTIVQTWQSSPA
eukprot:8560961-Pyramimonas_sp.AAC.1